MKTLESYVSARWRAGQGPAATLVNPATEEKLASCSTGGIDLAAVLAHARTVGGPALRALSFGERGQRLKALSAALHERREEMIDLAVANGGNTRGDAKFDIDGATGTLAAYAALAPSLSDRPFLSDAGGVQLGRSARFWGQHVWVPRLGVAVHINAFNFPAWGMMEKLAAAVLAGVPVVEKPGTATALLAWRIAQITVESGHLPEGSYQFLCGGVGDLLDHLRAQDCVAFTGSSATGARLRAHPSIVRHNVRLNVEADSLNAAVLAPDVEAGSDAYRLFVANVVLDMTQKAGQKCTAVRRILVPSDRVADVRDDLVAELQRVRVGNPADADVRMGPVTSASQLEEVCAGITALSAVADIACGGAARAQQPGYFVAPTLLVARDSNADVLHELEVFGPCATILPYAGDATEAVRLVASGGGGLVSSVYANDREWTESYVLGVAPWHGRVWIGSDKIADQSLPPGMVLPNLVHGGPGRAGGGEELGGERGLAFYMQRTALQGFRGLVEKRFGPPGAENAAS
jgi:oxepin-CoA hydrolase/3-oxo-5,6-dehydrosuberyl-CoA semialdehyde dehydrogenase